MKKLIAVVAVLCAASVYANQFETLSVGKLEVEKDIVASDGSLTISNATIAGATISGTAALATVTVSGTLGVTGDLSAQDAAVGALTVSTNAWIAGTLGVTGTVTVTGDSTFKDVTLGALTVSTSAAFSATSGRITLGTNIGTSAEVLIGTAKVSIVNGIITQYGY